MICDVCISTLCNLVCQCQHGKCQMLYGLEGLGRGIRGWGHALGHWFPVFRCEVVAACVYVCVRVRDFWLGTLPVHSMTKNRKAWRKKRSRRFGLQSSTNGNVHSDERILHDVLWRLWCHRQLLFFTVFHVFLAVYLGTSWKFTSSNNGNRMKPRIISECGQVQLLG